MERNLLIIEKEHNGQKQEFEILENEDKPQQLVEEKTSQKQEETENKTIEGRTQCEVWSRVVGYLRPTKNWNDGKLAEWEERKVFEIR